MVQLQPRKGLPPRTQRGGESFRGEAVDLIADFATLFLDPQATPTESRHLIERTLEAFSDPVLEAFAKRFNALVGRDLRRRVASAPEALVGQVIQPISKFLCRIAPNCTAETISQEVANRKETTVQGAHAWMLRPFALGPSELSLRGTKAPLAAGALWLLELDAKFSCAEHGNADEMLRFYPVGAPYPGARKAIERGCSKGKR